MRGACRPNAVSVAGAATAIYPRVTRTTTVTVPASSGIHNGPARWCYGGAAHVTITVAAAFARVFGHAYYAACRVPIFLSCLFFQMLLCCSSFGRGTSKSNRFILISIFVSDNCSRLDRTLWESNMI